jgi:hypothetical protein
MGRRDRNTKMVGYPGNEDSSKTAHWHTIMDLDFKSMTAGSLAENQGSLTALDGYEYHCRRGNADFDANMTNGTGLVVDFATSSSQQNRIAFKIVNYPRLTDGSYPRMRVSASFTGLVFSHNADYIAVGITSGFANNASPFAPGLYLKYDCTDSTADPVTKKYGSVLIAGWDGTTSATQPWNTLASNNQTTGVLTVEDRGAGMFFTRGDDGTTTIKGGTESQTFRNNMFSLYKPANDKTDGNYWYDPSGSEGGPYAQLMCKAGSNGSQAVTWLRLLVEAYF